MRTKYMPLLSSTVVLASTLFAQSPSAAPPAMTEKEVTTELKKLGSDQLQKDLRTRGAAFELDANSLKSLRKAKASDDIIRAIGDAGPQEAAAFDHAKTSGTSAAVDAYLQRYPSGRHKNEAAQLDAELTYKEASSQKSAIAYENFLKRFPANSNTAEVRQALEELKYNSAAAADTAAAYEKFLSEYPQGQLSTLASSHLRAVRLKNARAAATSAAYETFLKQYPEGADSDELKLSLPVIKEFEKSLRLGQVLIEMAPKASNMLEIGVVAVGGRAVEVGKLEIRKSPTFDSNLKELRQLLDAHVASDAVRISGYQAPSESNPTFNTGVQGLKVVFLGNPGKIVPSDRPGMTLLEYCKANGLREACDVLEAHGAK